MRRPALRARGRFLGLIVVIAVATAGAWFVAGSLTPRLMATLRAVQASPVDFAFEPEPLRLPALTQVSLTFSNASTAPHTLVLLSPIGVQTASAVDAGASVRLNFSTPDRGTYRFVCNVHEGMAGTLVVE